MTLDEFERLCNEATPGPWAWGEGWATIRRDDDGGYNEKYADLALRGPGRDVIPLRIDHYGAEWDPPTDLDMPNASDRAFLAACREMVPKLFERIRELEGR